MHVCEACENCPMHDNYNKQHTDKLLIILVQGRRSRGGLEDKFLLGEGGVSLNVYIKILPQIARKPPFKFQNASYLK